MRRAFIVLVAVLSLGGCQSYLDWVHSGGNIGPDIGQYLPGGKNYEEPGGCCVYDVTVIPTSPVSSTAIIQER